MKEKVQISLITRPIVRNVSPSYVLILCIILFTFLWNSFLPQIKTNSCIKLLTLALRILSALYMLQMKLNTAIMYLRFCARDKITTDTPVFKVDVLMVRLRHQMSADSGNTLCFRKSSPFCFSQ